MSSKLDTLEKKLKKQKWKKDSGYHFNACNVIGSKYEILSMAMVKKHLNENIIEIMNTSNPKFNDHKHEYDFKTDKYIYECKYDGQTYKYGNYFIEVACHEEFKLSGISTTLSDKYIICDSKNIMRIFNTDDIFNLIVQNKFIVSSCFLTCLTWGVLIPTKILNNICCHKIIID